MIEYIVEYFTQDRTSALEWISLIVDSVLALSFLASCFFLLFKHVKFKVAGPICLVYAGLLAASYFLDLLFIEWILYIILALLILMGVVYLVPEIKNILNKNTKIKGGKNFLANDQTKEELIDTLIKSVEHLSSRRVGAIITIEKEHSLNAYIEKGVKLEALVSFELLNTVFHPNTALHDGAVIIRGNHIMGASCFYPSSDKADIPQQYGSRHRAAIGISEVTDAFTIVVSEETGKIATTIGGTITGNVSMDSLRLSLSQHIIVK